MQIECCWAHAPEFKKPGLGKSPETLNPVDVGLAVYKFVLTMIHAEMLFIPQVDQPIVTAPAIGVDDRLQVDSSSNDRLECFTTTVGNDFGVDFTVSSEYTKDNGLPESTTSTFALDATGTEIAFIDFHFTGERGLLFTVLGNALTYGPEVSVDRVPVKTGQRSDLESIQIQSKKPDKFADFLLRNFGTASILVNCCHDRTYSLLSALS